MRLDFSNPDKFKIVEKSKSPSSLQKEKRDSEMAKFKKRAYINGKAVLKYQIMHSDKRVDTYF